MCWCSLCLWFRNISLITCLCWQPWCVRCNMAWSSEGGSWLLCQITVPFYENTLHMINSFINSRCYWRKVIKIVACISCKWINSDVQVYFWRQDPNLQRKGVVLCKVIRKGLLWTGCLDEVKTELADKNLDSVLRLNTPSVTSDVYNAGLAFTYVSCWALFTYNYFAFSCKLISRRFRKIGKSDY